MDRKSQDDEQSAQGRSDVIADWRGHVAVVVGVAMVMADFRVLKIKEIELISNCNIFSSYVSNSFEKHIIQQLFLVPLTFIERAFLHFHQCA